MRVRAFPADCPRVSWIFTAGREADEYQTAFEDIPAYGSVLLRQRSHLRTVHGLLLTSLEAGAIISAALCTLPCSSDCLISRYIASLAYSL